MKWPTKYTAEEYVNGTTRIKRKFAWFPVRISGWVVWLQNYEVMEYWQVTQYRIDDKHTAVVSQWIDLSKRLIK